MYMNYHFISQFKWTAQCYLANRVTFKWPSLRTGKHDAWWNIWHRKTFRPGNRVIPTANPPMHTAHKWKAWKQGGIKLLTWRRTPHESSFTCVHMFMYIHIDKRWWCNNPNLSLKKEINITVQTRVLNINDIYIL